MTKRHLFSAVVLTLVFFLSVGGCRENKASRALELYDLKNGQTLTGDQTLQAVQGARLVLVGEHHTTESHHRDQLRIIRFFKDNGVPLSIGMEMFRKDQQAALDRWVAGDLREEEFRPIYLDNWNFPWELYRDIFVYARDNKIPLVGLNVSREITRQVASQGFASLSDQQRGELEGVTCNVTREYRDYIRRAYGAHGHGNMDFIRFCEAQLVWDTAMAIHAVNHLEEHPGQVMVLLAGSAHARKMGIPYQVQSRRPTPLAVLLPYTPNFFEPDIVTIADADFIILP